MAWPETITDDGDLREYAGVQGVARLLEDGSSYVGAHKAACNAAKRFVRSATGHGTDPDKVTNTTDFKTPVLNYALFLIFRVTHPDHSEKFLTGFFAEMRGTTPVCDAEDREDGGGDFAPINVYKGSGRNSRGSGGGPWYRGKPSGGRYGGF